MLYRFLDIIFPLPNSPKIPPLCAKYIFGMAEGYKPKPSKGIDRTYVIYLYVQASFLFMQIFSIIFISFHSKYYTHDIKLLLPEYSHLTFLGLTAIILPYFVLYWLYRSPPGNLNQQYNETVLIEQQRGRTSNRILLILKSLAGLALAFFCISVSYGFAFYLGGLKTLHSLLGFELILFTISCIVPIGNSLTLIFAMQLIFTSFGKKLK